MKTFVFICEETNWIRIIDKVKMNEYVNKQVQWPVLPSTATQFPHWSPVACAA